MLLVLSVALAQSTLDHLPEEPADGPVIFAPVTEHTFEGVKVDGAVVRPEGIVTIERRRAVFNPMISVRTDWRAEIAASVHEAQ